MSAPADERLASYTTPRPDVAALVPPGTASLLDLGCSNGAFGAGFSAAGVDVTGIEFDAGLAAEASDRLDAVYVADLGRPGWTELLADRRFDVIVAADVLEHVADPVGVLTDATRFLTDEGCVIVSIPNVRHISALAEIAVRGRFPRRERGIFDATHLRWFTWREVLDLHARAGLVIGDWTSSIRLVDRPGAPSSDWAERTFGRWRDRGPIREFLSYQFIVRSHPGHAR